MRLRRSLLASAPRNTQWSYYMQWIYFQTTQIWIWILEKETAQSLLELLKTGWQKLRNLGRSPNSFTDFFVPTGQPSCALCLLISCLFMGITVPDWGQAQCRAFVQLDTSALQKAKRNYPDFFVLNYISSSPVWWHYSLTLYLYSIFSVSNFFLKVPGI